MSPQTYKLGQVSWALWRYFTVTQVGAPESPPRPFLTRIKRLLELDRKMEKDIISRTKQARYAFHDEVPQGHGIEVPYSPFNAFVLAIGLDLLDAGYKQSEVVFLLRHIRPLLFEQYGEIRKNPFVLGQSLHPNDRPGSPTYTENGFEKADCRVFLLIDQSEFLELYPSLPEDWPKRRPIYLEPAFCRGVEALKEYMYDRMPHHRRKTCVQELAMAGSLIPDMLTNAPEFKRGRAGS